MSLDTPEYEARPYRVVGSDDVEVALARFAALRDAVRLARGMNDLRENWDPSNKRCRPPYRVQRVAWEDVIVERSG